MTITRADLRSEASQLLGARIWAGTAETGSTTTSLIDTGDGGLRDAALSSFLMDGLYVNFLSGNPSGSWRMLKPGGFVAGSGSISWNEPFSKAIDPGDTYEILALLDPAQWNSALNRALPRLRYRSRSPLSLVADADMEQVSTDEWATSGALQAKTTAESFTLMFSYSGGVIEGAQALAVKNIDAGGYDTNATPIRCNPGDSFRLWADYRSLVGTARLEAWDGTNTVRLAYGSGSDGGDNGEGGMIFLGFTAPATCRTVEIHLMGVEASAVIVWDNVILNRVGRRRYRLPTSSWITERDQIVGIVERLGSRPAEYEYLSVGYPLHIDEDPTGVYAFELELPPGVGDRPLYIEGNRSYGTLATDAATTQCPLEWASYAVAAQVLQEHGRLLENSSIARRGLDRALIESHLQQLSDRLAPSDPHPIGSKTTWTSTVGNPFYDGWMG